MRLMMMDRAQTQKTADLKMPKGPMDGRCFSEKKAAREARAAWTERAAQKHSAHGRIRYPAVRASNAVISGVQSSPAGGAEPAAFL